MTYPDPRPRIIAVICGSMRFPDELADAAWRETIAGHIVIAPHVNMHRSHPMWLDPADAERIKTELDALHLDKIRMAHQVLVVNPGGYIGQSTRREIEFARSLGTPVRYTADSDKPPADPAQIAEAVAQLQADTTNGGMVARCGDRMADLHDAVTQARAEDSAGPAACFVDETAPEAAT
ncbi:hypothetical protein OG216_46740 (plasmid) [Streptomycetaceae bacterium NBC_01309]